MSLDIYIKNCDLTWYISFMDIFIIPLFLSSYSQFFMVNYANTLWMTQTPFLLEYFCFGWENSSMNYVLFFVFSKNIPLYFGLIFFLGKPCYLFYSGLFCIHLDSCDHNNKIGRDSVFLSTENSWTICIYSINLPNFFFQVHVSKTVNEETMYATVAKVILIDRQGVSNWVLQTLGR